MRGEGVKVSENLSLVGVREIRAGARKGKGGLHRKRRQVPKRKGRASKKGLLREIRRKHEWVSERKSSPGRSAESWFHSESGQTLNQKGGRETKCPLIK